MSTQTDQTLTADAAWAILREMDEPTSMYLLNRGACCARWGRWEVNVSLTGPGPVVFVWLERAGSCCRPEFFTSTEAGLRDACAKAAQNYISETQEA